MNTFNQRNTTRNQSTVDYRRRRIFIFDNRYQEAIFKNTTAGELVLKPGSLVLRDTAVAGQVKPAVDDDTIIDTIGILKLDEELTVPAGATISVNFCISGYVDETHIELPGAATLEKIVTGDSKTLRDHLHALGFHLQASVDNTKYDN